MRTVDDGAAYTNGEFQLIGTNSTFRVNANNTTTAIEQITARSKLYDVTFTFNVTHQTFINNGAPELTFLKTEQVNQIAGLPHVQGVRGEEDQGTDGNLYNYLVVTVGTDDREITTDVRVRMDQLDTPGAVGAINAAWSNLTALGA
jgi:hypothetical protein